VFSFEQTGQASICQTFQRLGLRQVRCHAPKWRTSRRPVKRSVETAAYLKGQPWGDFRMSLETILIIVLIVFLLGGGGWYFGRGRG
jgi:hypothetical protein